MFSKGMQLDQCVIRMETISSTHTKERAGLSPSLLQKALPLPCVFGPCCSQGCVKSVSHPMEQHKPWPFETVTCSDFCGIWNML